MTAEVFGITRDVPLNYIARTTVDGELLESLGRDKHVVIFGSSKQGKTSLRKHCLKSNEYIVVQCSNKWDIDQLHAAVLKQAGFEIGISEKRTVGGRSKIWAKISAKFFGAGVEAGANAERSESTETTTQPLELDASDANDIIYALKSIGFDKFIVLEDFHYLTYETQKDFAIALKAFHEASNLSFIVVGVWLEENRLIVYNGDLAGRITTVNADRWTGSELREVIEAGESLLNVAFSTEFKDSLVNSCQDSVFVVQEVCRALCEAEGVFKTQNDLRSLSSPFDVTKAIAMIVDQQSARYNSFILQFSDGFQATELEMYRWLLHPVLTAKTEELERGLHYPDIMRHLKKVHPRGKGLNAGNLTQALQSTANLQVHKGIQPIILDYDYTSRRLNVVDKGFLIWLAHQNTDNLLEVAGFDEDDVASPPRD